MATYDSVGPEKPNNLRTNNDYGEMHDTSGWDAPAPPESDHDMDNKDPYSPSMLGGPPGAMDHNSGFLSPTDISGDTGATESWTESDWDES